MAIELVAFDLDGTLVRGATCVEAIARRIGRSEGVASLERLSMRDVEGVSSAREPWPRGSTTNRTRNLLPVWSTSH